MESCRQRTKARALRCYWQDDAYSKLPEKYMPTFASSLHRGHIDSSASVRQTLYLRNRTAPVWRICLPHDGNR